MLGARRPGVVAAMLISLLFVVGCGGSDENPGEASQLRIAVPEDEGPINIFAGSSEPLTYLVYDKLLSPSPHADDPQPWLAESVEQLDPETWEVEIKNGIEWHDGEPLTVEDVFFSFDYAITTGITGRWTHHINQFNDVEEVEIVDGSTVRFTCAFPCPDLGPVTLADIPIIPQHVWEGVEDPTTYTELPVGTGPYRLVDYSTERGYRFEANEDYFAGEPLVDELVMPVIADPSSAFTALRADEIDTTTHSVPPELLEDLQQSAEFEVVQTSPLQPYELKLNFLRELFRNHEFNRALSGMVDRQALLDTVLLGQGRPGTQGYPHPDGKWSSPDNQQPSDPDEARRILDELEFIDRDGDGVRETPEGEPLELEIKTSGSEPTHVRSAELLAEQFAEFGLAVTVRTLDVGTLAEQQSEGEYDMIVRQGTEHGADPTQFIQSHYGVPSGYLWSMENYDYPEMQARIDDWMAAETLEARTDTHFAMQELFNSQPTTITLLYPDKYWAFDPDVYDNFADSIGYGIVHKWSFLPEEIADDANAINERFD